MSKADIIIALVLALAAYLGYKRGFLLELFYFLAIVLGIFAGFKLTGWGMEVLQQQFNADKKFLPYLAFAIIFVLVLVGTLFIGNRIKHMMDATFLGKVDAIAGAALSVIKYAFCLSVLIWLANSMKVSLPPHWTAGSFLYPQIGNLAPKMSVWASDLLPFFKETFRQF
ncbi:MAG: CvpA family protein [Bacteroidota bacterium]|nr:CvpA family protein [Cytophagales bacterium]MCE2957425.1 CvpA family protein [Flammeovirgaceae bacterium]MCZ8069711.1 CvpA family protein [Cytophagales bacterium]